MVTSLHIEKRVPDEESFAAKLADRLRQLAAFNGCDAVIFRPFGREGMGSLLVAKL